MLKERSRLQAILRSPGASNRAIARLRGCSPTTIGKYRARIEILGLTREQLDVMKDSQILTWLNGQVAADGEKVEPDWNWVLLMLQKGRSRQYIHDAFLAGIERQPAIAYRTLCGRIPPLLDRKNPTMRIIHRAGEKLEVDFAGFTPRGIFAGEPCSFALFVAILPCSGHGFACVVRNQTLPNWISANEQAFRFLGVVPHILVSDNLAAAVTSRPKNKPPVINSTFARFLDHHDTALMPTRVRKPQDKASVERLVRDVQDQLKIALEDRPLMTLDEMNLVLLDIMEGINGRPERSGLGETRREFFERVERPEMKPLCPREFEFFIELQFRKVPRDYYLKFENVHYSVPCELIGKPAILHARRDTVEIHHDGGRVAVHDRSWMVGERVLNTDHMPKNHRKWQARQEADLCLWAEDFGEVVRQLAHIEHERGFTGAVRRNQFELLDTLARQAGRDAFEAACLRAREAGALSLGHVRNLLARNLQNTPLQTCRPRRAANDVHENIRGSDYYRGRK